MACSEIVPFCSINTQAWNACCFKWQKKTLTVHTYYFYLDSRYDQCGERKQVEEDRTKREMGLNNNVILKPHSQSCYLYDMCLAQDSNKYLLSLSLWCLTLVATLMCNA